MALIQNKNNGGIKKAFTLIEIIVVMAVVVVLIGVGLGGMLNTQRQLVFLTAYEQVLLTVRDQRSLSLAGKAIPDYTDYDRDGCKAPPTVGNTGDCPYGSSYVDFVTPANYGVSFDITTPGAMTVTTFADLYKGDDLTQIEGQFQPPSASLFYTYTPRYDVVLSQYKLDSRLGLISNLFKDSNTRVDIFFSPIFGDFSVKPDLDPMTQKFLVFGVEDPQEGRKKCSKIHPLAGMPETATDAECINP